jgi:apolipoprotein N-acyltransferase
LLLVSSFVYALAFPGFVTKTGIGFIAFFALIPVFMVIRRTSWKLIPWYGFFYGFMFYLFFNYWLKTFHPLAILIVPIIKGGEMLLLFPCLKAADRWFRKRGFLVQAIIWTAYTYLSQSWFAGYPYGTIAYAIWQYRPLIQTASLWGIWGINFLMILPQAFFAVPLADHTSVKEWLGERKPTMIIYAAVIVSAWSSASSAWPLGRRQAGSDLESGDGTAQRKLLAGWLHHVQAELQQPEEDEPGSVGTEATDDHLVGDGVRPVGGMAREVSLRSRHLRPGGGVH